MGLAPVNGLFRQVAGTVEAGDGGLDARRLVPRGRGRAPVTGRAIDAVRDGAAVAPVGAVYQIDQIVEAHTAMEEGRLAGKIVVLT